MDTPEQPLRAEKRSTAGERDQQRIPVVATTDAVLVKVVAGVRIVRLPRGLADRLPGGGSRDAFALSCRRCERGWTEADRPVFWSISEAKRACHAHTHARGVQ